MRRFNIVMAAAALVFLAAPVLALDNSQPPAISVGTCIEHGGTVEQPEDSAIRACCLDGLVARGCYICDYKWENCEWDPAYGSRVQGTAPFDGTAGQTLSPDGGAATPDTRIIDQLVSPDGQPQFQVMQPQPFPGESKDGGKATRKNKLQVIQPLSVLQPVSVACTVDGRLVLLQNTTGGELAKGTPIGWRTSAGEEGTAPLYQTVGANAVVRLVRVNPADSCTAWLVKPSPGLVQ